MDDGEREPQALALALGQPVGAAVARSVRPKRISASSTASRRRARGTKAIRAPYSR